MNTPRSADLYWSLKGRVACADHAPPRDSAEWTGDRWQPIPETATKIRYQCERCAANGSPIAHHHVVTAPSDDR